MNCALALIRLKLKPAGFVSRIRLKGSSSHDWLERQHSDPYVEKSKLQNYRNEIDEKVRFLRPGQVVVDIGAAPGSWTQVAVKKVNADASQKNLPIGTVISIDKQHIYPIEGATLLGNLDFETQEAQDKLREALSGLKVDAVISDMAPNASGIKSLDRDKIMALCYKAFRFAAQVSDKGGCLLVKVWDGSEAGILEMDLGRFYKNVRVIKPPASRSDSSEKFLFAKGFKGLQER